MKERMGIKWWFDNWNGDVIKHNRQTDDSSCGVHVIEVKKIDFFTKVKLKKWCWIYTQKKLVWF